MWNGLEEEIRPYLRRLSSADLFGAYHVFYPNQKGSADLWDQLTVRFASIKESDWHTDFAEQALDRQDHLSNLYKE